MPGEAYSVKGYQSRQLDGGRGRAMRQCIASALTLLIGHPKGFWANKPECVWFALSLFASLLLLLLLA